jgi:hypothetical protein
MASIGNLVRLSSHTPDLVAIKRHPVMKKTVRKSVRRKENPYRQDTPK